MTIDIAAKIEGIELLETDTDLGGEALSAGTILLTLDANDSSVGDNGISADEQDICYLTVTQATLGSGTTAADATDR